MHFASDSFTTEYKITDHLGCYTRVLKYDAVPTLYLPAFQPLVMKLDSTSTGIAMQPQHVELEDVLVQSLSCAEECGSFTPSGMIDAASSIKLMQCDSTGILQENKSDAHLSVLREENAKLQRRIDGVKSELDSLQNKLSTAKCKYQNACSEYNSVREKHTFLKVSMMTVQQQKNVLAKVFSESQIKILSGKKKIYWSNDDMAMGYTLRHMSNKRCYTYLSKNLNIPLPALSSIKRWATIKDMNITK